MDIHHELSSLLSGCVWVKSPGEALRRVPALASELPVLVRLPTESTTRVPVADAEAVVQTVVRTLVAASSRVLSGGMGERVDQLSEDDLAADPLVQILEERFSQLGYPGIRRDVVPILTVCWVCSRVLGGLVGELRLRDKALIRQAEKLADRLQGMEPGPRGEALAGLSWEIAGRAAAAQAIVAHTGRSLRNGGLSRSLLPSRLLMSFPRGSLDRGADLPLVSSLLGLGMSEEVLRGLVRVTRLALQGVSERLAEGKGTGVDQAISQALEAQLTPESPRSALLHSVAGPLLVGSLPALIRKRELKAAGLDKEMIAAFSDPVRMAALAATWTDMVAALCEWDVLSVLVDRVSLLSRESSGWSYRGKELDRSATWEALLPREDPERPLSVVAIRFTDVREMVDHRAQDTGRRAAAGVVENAWARFCEERGGGAHAWVGDHGVMLLEDPFLALGFAREAQAAFEGPYELPIGARGGTIAIRPGLRVGVGIAHGKLVGGSDGRNISLGGPAVGRAIGLTGSGMLDGAAEEAGGYRRSVNGRMGLCSEGLVVGPVFLEVICEALERDGTPVRGPVKPGDEGREFEFFPVICWWSRPGGAVVAMGLVDGGRGGSAAELVDMDDEAFEAFCDADRIAGRMQRGKRVRQEARWEGFGGERVEEKTDDIDAVFLGRVEGERETGEPVVFAPDPIAMVVKEDEPWPKEIVGAPMILDDDAEAASGAGSEVPGPAVFIDDDWDTDGWEENSWEDENWGETAASLGGVAAPGSDQLRSAVEELKESFVVVRAGGSFFFGRLDGPSLRDAIQCQTVGDTLEAYKTLLVHHLKLVEGGARPGVMGVQDDWVPEPLDAQLIEKAIAELGW
jgi:hypothetical protein